MRASQVMLGGIVLVALAGCSEARRDRPGRTEKAAAPAPAPAVAPVATTPAPGPLLAEQAKGTSLLQIWLPAPKRLGGFALALTWDPHAFVLGAPQSAAALNGYLCQPNLATPGQMRFNCVGLPNEDRGGLLASIPVSWRDRAPVVADFKVVQAEVVDDRGAILPETRLELQVAAAAP